MTAFGLPTRALLLHLRHASKRPIYMLSIMPHISLIVDIQKAPLTKQCSPRQNENNIDPDSQALGGRRLK